MATATKPPTVIPFVRTPPEPLVTFVNHSRNCAGFATAVARVWPPGTGYCGLCPVERCNSTQDTCLVSVKRFVHSDDAA